MSSYWGSEKHKAKWILQKVRSTLYIKTKLNGLLGEMDMSNSSVSLHQKEDCIARRYGLPFCFSSHCFRSAFFSLCSTV